MARVQLAVMALAAAVALGPGTAAAQTVPDVPVVSTSGEAEIKRAPDVAWVDIQVETRAKDPKEAQRQNIEAMNAVLQKLKGMNLGEDAIRTTAVELRPEFDYNNGRQTLRGYVARNVIEVRVDDIRRVGEVLSAAVASGATSIGGLRFDLKNRDAAEREALRLAVMNARARAEAAASAAGLRIERILRIDDQRIGSPGPMPVPMPRMAATAEAMPDVPVTPGDITIRAIVNLTAAVR